MFSFHLADVSAVDGARAMLLPPSGHGLRQVEVMARMRLGAPVVSFDRLQVRRLAVFARWDDEAALESFLGSHWLGRRLGRGWHLRLQFVRRWGGVSGFDDLPEEAERVSLDEPVVAFTLARMRLTELPRFIAWGRPVEEQVRDHPASTMSLAAIRPPNSVATFSMWDTARDMTDMVFGRRDSDERHVKAMGERERRDFHYEFTTLRFRTVSEHGARPAG